MMTNSTVTAADFTWLREAGWGITYGVTVARGITPEEALRRLEAEVVGTAAGMDGVSEVWYMDRAGCAMDRRAAARPKCSSSATATKYSSSRVSSSAMP